MTELNIIEDKALRKQVAGRIDGASKIPAKSMATRFGQDVQIVRYEAVRQ